MNRDHVLLIGFGGPESPDQIMPYLRQVTAGRGIPDHRLKIVAHHYELIGGKSPYNVWAEKLKNDLSHKINLPVFLGYRNTAPFLKDTIAAIHSRGLKRGTGMILAPFRSPSSCRRYKQNVHDALHELGIVEQEYVYPQPWYQAPGLTALTARLVRDALKKIPAALLSDTQILFSAHSIPTLSDRDCSACIYSAEYETACRLTAEAAGLKEWKIVYQSRSGAPGQPWLGPDILDAVKEAASAGKKAVFIIPMGFLCDNAEVLYDLDIEAKNEAEKLGLEYFRAATPGNDPALTDLMAGIIQESIDHPAVCGCHT